MSMTQPQEYIDRQRKRAELLEAGVSPYPSTAKRTHEIGSVIAEEAALTSAKTVISVVGRLMSLRLHGGSFFADLQDATGQMQVYLKKNNLPDGTYDALVASLDRGDFVSVTGLVQRTHQGELTVLASEAQLLTKAIRPLPDKWSGLHDLETRARKRYLDFLANPRSKEIILERSKIVRALRMFAEQHGYIEVETPELQPIYGGGFARPFITHHNALDIDLYLRISNELYLKRMLVGGFEKIFEICRDFRNEGVDQRHNPEFTMVEFMTAYQDYRYSMDLVEELYAFIAQSVFGKLSFDYNGAIVSLERPWRRVAFFDIVSEVVGQQVSPDMPIDQLRTIVQDSVLVPEHKAAAKKLQTVGELAGLLFEELGEKTLIQPTMVYDYPVELSPLAKQSPNNPLLVERFEHFIGGIEHGNHYSELNDPVELRKRFIDEKKKEAAGFDEAHQTDDDFVEAIEHGMPPATGIGIGIDRMVMLMSGAKSIREAIAFPTVKPIKDVSGGVNEEVEQEDVPMQESARAAQNEPLLEPGMSFFEAEALLGQHMTNPALLRHALAVQLVMQAFAEKFGHAESSEAWGIAGLLHDMDWEQTKDEPERHSVVAKEILEDTSMHPTIIDAIHRHNHLHQLEPMTLLARTLYCVEEVTGLVTAAALVQQDKKVSSVSLASLLKKFKDKSFAKGVQRDIIGRSPELIGCSVEDVLGLCLQTMQLHAEKLGL